MIDAMEPASAPIPQQAPQGQVGATQSVPNPQIAPQEQPSFPPAVQSAPFRKRNIFSHWWFWLLIFIIFMVTLSLLFSWFFIYPKIGNQIVVNDQVIVGSIHVDKLSLNTRAFLVFQPQDKNGLQTPSSDSYWGNTSLLFPDTYEDFDFPFVGETGLGPTPVTIIFATLYKDVNNNRNYDFYEDTEALTDLSGKKIRVQFQAL
jgi:hypothetical protein